MGWYGFGTAARTASTTRNRTRKQYPKKHKQANLNQPLATHPRRHAALGTRRRGCTSTTRSSIVGFTRQGVSGARTICCHCCLFVGCLGRGLLLLLAVRSVGKTYTNWAGSTALSSVHPRGDRSHVSIYALAIVQRGCITTGAWCCVLLSCREAFPCSSCEWAVKALAAAARGGRRNC